MAADAVRSAAASRTRSLYEEEGKLAHFRGLSERLFSQVGSLDLAQAAFLHGIDDFSILSVIPGAGPQVRDILQDRGKLRSIGGWGERNELTITDADGPELSRLLVGNVLPLIRNADAVALFIAEQIEELDQEQVLSTWTMAFPKSPSRLPPEFRLATARDRFLSNAARSAFLRYVVAATAQFFGMWQERNIAENVALLHGHPARFRQVLDFILRDVEVQGRAAMLVSMVADRLSAGQDVHWEWHHVASIDRAIGPNITADTWGKRFDRAGAVVVECHSRADCYSVLEKLHTAFEYIPSEIRDKIGHAEPSGYRALHTTLVRRDEGQELVHVHIIFTEGRNRFALVDRAQIESVAARMQSDEKPTIRVFAPDGRAHDIPPGSLVINFAQAIHHDVLARLRGATVNRRYVRPNEMLLDGDVVWLDVADTPQHLPDEWFDQLPEATRARVRRDYLEGYRPAMLMAGRRWLRSRIEMSGCIATIDDLQIDQLLEDVPLVAFDPDIRNARGLLRQIGLLDARERGSPLVRELLIDRELAESVAGALIARIRESARLASEVDIPVELRERATRVEACTQCVPRADEALAAAIHGEVIVLHRVLASCAAGAERLTQIRRAVGRYFFVIETTNRAGVALEVVGVFQRHDVDIEEITGRRIGIGWGVIRICVDFVSLPRQLAIIDDLGAIAGVRRVLKPYDDPVPLLESLLPPRIDAAPPLWSRAEPYLAGPAIDDDRLFYGMTAQLAELDAAYMRVNDPGAISGETVYITGPLRTGKTSLGRRFLRTHEHDQRRPISVYVETVREPWSAVRPKVREKLIDAASLHDIKIGPRALLEDVIRTIRVETRVPMIIMIDEVSAMFSATGEDEAEIAGIEQFRRAVSSVPGVLLIWIGPQAAVRRLNQRLVNVLQVATRVDVRPLVTAEVRQLLAAEKLGHTYSIRLESGVAEAVFHQTAGNPFWISHIASRMYGLTASSSAETFFSLKDVADAVNLVLDERLPFADRLPRTAVEQLVIRQMLRLMPDSQAAGIGEKALEELREVTDGEALQDAILELTLAGTIVKEHNSRWRIAAPILHQFLAMEFGSVR